MRMLAGGPLWDGRGTEADGRRGGLGGACVVLSPGWGVQRVQTQ